MADNIIKKNIEEPEEDYDIVPHKRIIELEKQVDEIRKNPFSAVPSGKEMMESMKALNRGVNDLVDLFKGASEEMKTEEHDLTVIEKQMGPVMEKLNEIAEQNKKIARGIIAVADMIKEQGARIERVSFSSPSPASSSLMSELPPGPEAPMRYIKPLPPGEMPSFSDFPPPPGASREAPRMMPMGGPEGEGMMPPPRLIGMPMPGPMGFRGGSAESKEGFGLFGKKR